MELLSDLTLALVAALAGGFLARRLGQPLIVGYIIAGIAVGPFTGGLSVINVHEIEQLAELGVALLLFSLGLEVSFRELAPVRAVALGGGAIQIVLTIVMGTGLATRDGMAVPAVALVRIVDCAVEHDGGVEDAAGAGPAWNAVEPRHAGDPGRPGPRGRAADDHPAGARAIAPAAPCR